MREPEILIPTGEGAYRFCYQCGEPRPASEFSRKAKRVLDLDPVCKICKNARYRQTHPRPIKFHGKGGCRKYVDLTGMRFGRLFVLERRGSKRWGNGSSRSKKGRTSVQWLVRCDCGEEKTVSSWGLRSGRTNSCGCLKLEMFVNSNSLPFGIAGRNYVIAYYKRAAKDRGLSWGLSDDQFHDLTKQDCFYCGSVPRVHNHTKGRSHTYNGVDRINNLVGYETGNVIPCCTTCNIAKNKMSLSDFVEWIKRAGQHLKDKPWQIQPLPIRSA